MSVETERGGRGKWGGLVGLRRGTGGRVEGECVSHWGYILFVVRLFCFKESGNVTKNSITFFSLKGHLKPSSHSLGKGH